MIDLYKNARSTPAIRFAIADSSETAATLVLRYGVSEGNVFKWKGRDSFHDLSYTAHLIQATLTTAQEHIVVELRKTLLLPLGDLLAVTHDLFGPWPYTWAFIDIFVTTVLATSMPSCPKNPRCPQNFQKASIRGTSTSILNS